MDFAKIAHEINTQDNRATEDPLFCVFEKERIYGLHGDYSDRFEYDKETGEKVYYVERDKFVNAHFTEAAAKEHIRINGHNLKSPFVYVTSMWRCPEMIAIRKALSNNQAPALPEPMREEPEPRSKIFIVDLVGNEITETIWVIHYRQKLNACLCHTTREAAQEWLNWWNEAVGRGK